MNLASPICSERCRMNYRWIYPTASGIQRTGRQRQFGEPIFSSSSANPHNEAMASGQTPTERSPPAKKAQGPASSAVVRRIPNADTYRHQY